MTVNLSDEAYEVLKSWKISDDESFSSLIVRILLLHKDLEEAFSKDTRKEGHYLSEEEAEQLKTDIE